MVGNDIVSNTGNALVIEISAPSIVAKKDGQNGIADTDRRLQQGGCMEQHGHGQQPLEPPAVDRADDNHVQRQRVLAAQRQTADLGGRVVARRGKPMVYNRISEYVAATAQATLLGKATTDRYPGAWPN